MSGGPYKPPPNERAKVVPPGANFVHSTNDKHWFASEKGLYFYSYPGEYILIDPEWETFPGHRNEGRQLRLWFKQQNLKGGLMAIAGPEHEREILRKGIRKAVQREVALPTLHKVSFRIEPEILDLLTDYGQQHGRDQSAMLRIAACLLADLIRRFPSAADA